MKVEGLNNVLAALQAKAADAAKNNASVLVGYTQQYAIYVHEDLTKVHPNGQAKFLEQPARELQPELAETVKNALKEGKTMDQALLLAGLQLQAASQRLVPVDTGALRASAFTRKEE